MLLIFTAEKKEKALKEGLRYAIIVYMKQIGKGKAMSDRKKADAWQKATYWSVAGVLLLIFLALLVLWVGHKASTQAMPAFVAEVYFDGEYRIAEGPWQPIKAGAHIPATQGDVTLRGKFHMRDPEGAYAGVCTEDILIALYMNHINLSVREGEGEAVVLDMEHPLYGICGANWIAHPFTSRG